MIVLRLWSTHGLIAFAMPMGAEPVGQVSGPVLGIYEVQAAMDRMNPDPVTADKDGE